MSYANFSYDLNEYLVYCKKNNISTDNYEAIVRDKWISDKRYKELIAFILENWDSGNCDEFSRPFSKHLLENNELKLFKQMVNTFKQVGSSKVAVRPTMFLLFGA